MVFGEDISSDGRETYVRAIVSRTDSGYVAFSTGSQGSHVLTSLVRANALVIIPEGTTRYQGRHVTSGLDDRLAGNRVLIKKTCRLAGLIILVILLDSEASGPASRPVFRAGAVCCVLCADSGDLVRLVHP